ncbi:helix-turn-helix domain-containing protein [Candidatus Electronema sp. PJ]|uniref:helix-turn-helix domain-containing protein n=1 Tax=Candidatus Electronema sp. PJ TaxID=3401572 RepID=UPI003AA9D4BB
MTIAIQHLEAAWGSLHMLIPFFPIRTPQQYEQATETLTSLLDIVGDNEKHPLYDLTDMLGTLIHAYEEDHFPKPDVFGRDVLRFLLEEHHMTAADLPEIGDENYLFDVLAGKQLLTTEHVKMLSLRFHVSPATFI